MSPLGRDRSTAGRRVEAIDFASRSVPSLDPILQFAGTYQLQFSILLEIQLG